MAAVRHMANLTKNNRRLARFYSLIFGMNELWNEWQNSSAAFYITDGYLNFNCLEILPVMSRPGKCQNRSYRVHDQQAGMRKEARSVG